MLSRRTVLSGFAVGLCATVLPIHRAGAMLAKPEGKVVLSVSGKIKTTNGDAVATFDLAMLDALPKRAAKVKTPWTEGEVTFEGPLGSAVLDAVGAEGKLMRITALNDYSVEVPVADFRDHPVILATRMNGAVMPVRQKGPIFVIYPFDLKPELYNEAIFSKSVWQVKSIEIS
jgi:hypothetical protein